MQHPMIIVGAGHAGGRAALTLREQGYQGRIVLIGAEAHLPYERPPLSKQLLTDGQNTSSCQLASAEHFHSLQIEHQAASRVSAIHPAHRQITLQDGSQQHYHKLLLATGGWPRLPALPGAGLAGILPLRTLDDAAALRTQLREGQRIVVMGGGFIGLEVAASARTLGCSVSLVEAADRLAARVLPARLADGLLQLHLGHGVQVHLSSTIAAFHGTTNVQAVELANGEVLPCDAVVVGIGIQPSTELAAAAGLRVDNGIVVDQHLQSSDPHIFAAGDVCAFPAAATGQIQRLETWRNAELQGRHAAGSMLGTAQPYVALNGFWSDQYDHSLHLVGSMPPESGYLTRAMPDGGELLFSLDAQGCLQGAGSLARGNALARDIKLAEMLISRGRPLDPARLADPAIALKTLLKED